MGRKSREKKERDQGKPCRFYLHSERSRSPMAEKLFENALGESNCEKEDSDFLSRYISHGW